MLDIDEFEYPEDEFDAIMQDRTPEKLEQGILARKKALKSIQKKLDGKNLIALFTECDKKLDKLENLIDVDAPVSELTNAQVSNRMVFDSEQEMLVSELESLELALTDLLERNKSLDKLIKPISKKKS